MEARSQDAVTQQAEEEETEQWARTGSSTEVETRLRNDLLSIFAEMQGEKNNVQALACINECFSGKKDESLMEDKKMMVPSYPTFNNFMNGKAQSRSGLKPKFLKSLQTFVSRKTDVRGGAASACRDRAEL
jgi:hypothetical protein